MKCEECNQDGYNTGEQEDGDGVGLQQCTDCGDMLCTDCWASLDCPNHPSGAHSAN